MRSSLIRIALALLIFAASIGAYLFLYMTISAKSLSVANLQSEIDSQTATAERVAAARAALAEIAGDEAVVQSYFVPEAGVVTFINSLQSIGTALGTQVAINSVSASGSGSHTELLLSLSVTGTFDGVLRTLGAIEYAPYDLSVISVAVSGDAKGWRANANLVVGSSASSTPSILPSPSVPTASATSTMRATTPGTGRAVAHPH